MDHDLLDLLSLLTSAQRAYVNNVCMKNMGPSPAARAAGLSKPPKTPKVEAAMRAMYARNAKRYEVGLEEIVQGYRDSIDAARAKGDPTAMINGYTALAKIAGLATPDTARTVNQINLLQLTKEQVQSMPYEQLASLMPSELRAQLVSPEEMSRNKDLS